MGHSVDKHTEKETEWPEETETKLIAWQAAIGKLPGEKS
jgi:hypothetical protein